MSFQLAFGQCDLALPLALDSQVEDRLLGIIGGDDSAASSKRARIKLAAQISDAISAVVVGEGIPPSEKQIKYAVAIAQELSLELPAEVLQFRHAMAVFLDTHAERYRRSRQP